MKVVGDDRRRNLHEIAIGYYEDAVASRAHCRGSSEDLPGIRESSPTLLDTSSVSWGARIRSGRRRSPPRHPFDHWAQCPAALDLAGPGAVLGLRSAARLHGFYAYRRAEGRGDRGTWPRCSNQRRPHRPGRGRSTAARDGDRRLPRDHGGPQLRPVTVTPTPLYAAAAVIQSMKRWRVCTTTRLVVVVSRLSRSSPFCPPWRNEDGSTRLLSGCSCASVRSTCRPDRTPKPCSSSSWPLRPTAAREAGGHHRHRGLDRHCRLSVAGGASHRRGRLRVARRATR